MQKLSFSAMLIPRGFLESSPTTEAKYAGILRETTSYGWSAISVNVAELLAPRPFSFVISRSYVEFANSQLTSLDSDMLKTLKKWNHNNPPTKFERERNDKSGRREIVEGARE